MVFEASQGRAVKISKTVIMGGMYIVSGKAVGHNMKLFISLVYSEVLSFGLGCFCCPDICGRNFRWGNV